MTIPLAVVPDRNLWLNHKRWDLTFLIGSAALAAVPLSLYYVFGVSTTVVNILVAALVGGPHLYSTFGYTLVEPSYRRQYGLLLLPCAVIPFAVGWLALNHMVLLLTIFFFWASVHVLHQIAYITDAYRHKDPRPRSLGNRMIDYGLIFTGLYPLATFKLVRGEFVVGGDKPLLIPSWALNQMWIPWAVVGLFLTFLTLYVIKTYREYKEDRLNVPSVALISVTTVVSLIIPTFSNLDVAFQGYNTWHSFQYLALVWYMNKLRKENGEITNRLMQVVSGEGTAWRFYATFLGATMLAVLVMLGLYRVAGFNWQQSYYSVALGSLLVHYYLDHFNFFRFAAVVREPTPRELAAQASLAQAVA